MIDRVEGVIQDIRRQSVVIQAGALSFELFVPSVHAFILKKNTSLYAYMHWNQDNGPVLFGFPTELEKQVFLLIISCNGIGPKLALAALDALGAQGFLQAIQQADDRALSTISGIGAKKAEQIVVSLKHKVQKLLESGIDVGVNTHLAVLHDVDQALVSLNYSRIEIARTLNHLKVNQTDKPQPFDQLLRSALAYLAQN